MSGQGTPPSRFQGLSLLREEEKKKQPQAPNPQASALQAYLQRYQSDAPADGERKKRKKKKPVADGGAIKIIDADLTAAAPAARRRGPPGDSDEDRPRSRGRGAVNGADDAEDEDAPVIANEAEAKLLMKQAEQAKEFYKRREDGSGWVNVDGPQRGGDASPPRRGRHDSPDASPPRRARHDSPDASPPRRPAGADASPPRRARHDSPDASPPRRGRHDSPDASPPRRKARHDSPDASPPRRPAGRDASPPRRGRHDSPDASPPRRKARHDSPDASPPRRPAGRDASPPRRGRHDSPDASPPRRPAGADALPPRRPQARMADGTAAGLVSAQQLAQDAARMRAEAEKRRQTAVGRDAETVYRDRATGRIVSQEEFQDQRNKHKKKDKDNEEVHLEWKQGLAQRRKAEELAARMAEEAAAPFARYENDRERDAILRSKTHFGDPMAGLLSSGPQGEPEAVTARYDVNKLKQSGFIIPQGIPSHSWLKRGVAAPGNRYDIKPGRHWDGVDRSNGFEKQMFAHQAAVRHRELEARAWAQSDM